MTTRDRLQPALLDRLVDDHRLAEVEATVDERRVMSKQQLRAAVLRDLSWLLNAIQPLTAEQARWPQVADSVINFGLPALSGSLASKLDIPELERTIRKAILRFEPRILADSLEVHAIDFSDVMSTHNLIEFEISGLLWAQPVPLELLLRTQVDLEVGQVSVQEGSRSRR